MESGKKRIAAAQALALEQSERAWQVWVRVRLGAERRIDVARAYRYRDGSAVSHVIRRLEALAAMQTALTKRMARLRLVFDRLMSCVKS